MTRFECASGKEAFIDRSKIIAIAPTYDDQIPIVLTGNTIYVLDNDNNRKKLRPLVENWE